MEDENTMDEIRASFVEIEKLLSDHGFDTDDGGGLKDLIKEEVWDEDVVSIAVDNTCEAVESITDDIRALKNANRLVKSKSLSDGMVVQVFLRPDDTYAVLSQGSGIVVIELETPDIEKALEAFKRLIIRP